MPTSVTWIDDTICSTSWQAPLTAHELHDCLTNIRRIMTFHDKPVHVMMDLTQAGTIAYLVPYLAIESGLLWHKNAGKFAVISSISRARLLASVMDKVTEHDMVFFATQTEAIAYLSVKLEKQL